MENFLDIMPAAEAMIVCECECVAVVEVAVLGRKRRKVSELTEMDVVAGAVQRVVSTFAYVCLLFLHQLCGVWCYILQFSLLTLSAPAVPNCCCSKGPAPYWSNPLFLIFDIRALWCSFLSTRVPECQKLKVVG